MRIRVDADAVPNEINVSFGALVQAACVSMLFGSRATLDASEGFEPYARSLAVPLLLSQLGFGYHGGGDAVGTIGAVLIVSAPGFFWPAGFVVDSG